MHFFDHNATTPLHPEARSAWVEAQDTWWLNPSSPYRAAARVRARLEKARAELAGLLGVDAPERIVFNSGASEGNNAVFAHWRERFGAEASVAVSPTEHPSVLEAAKHHFPGRWRPLPLDAAGSVDIGAAVRMITGGGVRGVSVMAANNETGLLNDWSGLAQACRGAGVRYHCDASQWVGKMPLAGLSQCDFVTACAHKFGGPRGAGFLLLPAESEAFGSLRGGGQESGHRAGTENVAAILAMVAALKEAVRATEDGRALSAPRDAFERAVRQALPGVEIVGEGRARLWNTVALILPPPAAPRWIRALEKRGFLISAGSACSTGKPGPSPVLAAMGIPAGAMSRAVRISSGPGTTEGEWEALLAALVDASVEFAAEGPEVCGPGDVISI